MVAVAGGLKVPNGLALAPDGTLLIAEQDRIIGLAPSGRAKVIVPRGVLPDQSHHGWRYAGLGPDGRLYVAIGAPCNICAIKGFEGTIIRLRPDGHELEIFARGIRNSVQLAIDEASEANLLPGWRLALVAVDDSSNPDVGRRNASRLLDDPTVIGVVGTYNSGVAAAVAPEFESADIALISPGNTDPSLTRGPDR